MAYRELSIRSMLMYFLKLVDQSLVVRVPLKYVIHSDALASHQVSISDDFELFFIQNVYASHTIVIHQCKLEYCSTPLLHLP